MDASEFHFDSKVPAKEFCSPPHFYNPLIPITDAEKAGQVATVAATAANNIVKSAQDTENQEAQKFMMSLQERKSTFAQTE